MTPDSKRFADPWADAYARTISSVPSWAFWGVLVPLTGAVVLLTAVYLVVYVALLFAHGVVLSF